MITILFKPLSIKGQNQSGSVLVFVVFILAALAVVVPALWRIASTAGINFTIPGEARKAAQVCLDMADTELGSSAQDNYTTCTDGQFFVFNTTGGCVTELSDSAAATVAVGDHCSCALSLDVINQTTYTVNSIGRCYTPGGTRQDNAYSEVILQANLATGTPPCTPTCTPNSVPEFGDCSDGCGNACTDAVCLVGATVLHCKANGTPPPTWACLR